MRNKPDPFDISVGNRIRFFRTKSGHTQESVADALGMTFQQVQKYEKGTNRTAPSRLIVMARLFKVPVSAFFDERPGNGNGKDIDYAELLATNNRQAIFKRLVELNSQRIEHAVMTLLDELTKRS